MTPLLLVPGTLCDERLFAPMVERLGPHARALPPIAHATVEEAADAVLADAPDRFTAAGFSLGGFVVLELLRRAPGRLAGAALIASNVESLPGGQADERRAEAALAAAQGPDAVVERLWPRYVARSRLGDMALRARVGEMAEAVGAGRFACQAELAITRPDSRDTVRRTRIPLLVLCGEEDAICPPARCGAVDGPTVERRTVPGAGHFVPLEAADEAAALMAAWLREPAACC